MTELEPQFMEVVETSALELRKGLDVFQQGISGGADLKVTAGATGRSVDVAAGVGYINGTHVVDQGRYRIRNDAVKNSDAFVLGGIPANTSGLPRLDQIVARIYDQTHDNSGQRKWQLEVFAGTPAAGVTLDNRSGFTPIPLSSMLLADLVTPSGATTILPANIRDRRPWARGALFELFYGGALPTITTADAPMLAASGSRVRLECSGRPVKITLSVPAIRGNGDNHFFFTPYMDGAPIAGSAVRRAVTTGVNYWFPFSWEWLVTPAAGSHTFEMFTHASAVDGALTAPMYLEVAERFSDSANNGTT
jgi:hypothetical protein